jgi:hypothetical protein
MRTKEEKNEYGKRWREKNPGYYRQRYIERSLKLNPDWQPRVKPTDEERAMKKKQYKRKYMSTEKGKNYNRKKSATWRKTHKEKFNAQMQRWRDKNIEKYRAYQNEYHRNRRRLNKSSNPEE